MMSFALPTPDRTFRIDGCTDGCQVVKAIVPGRYGRTELLLHDPIAHQEYGRRLATPSAYELVHTGRLIVDLTAARVFIDGREKTIWRQQWELLACLARRPGVTIGHRELKRVLWGEGALDLSAHALRALVSRLRDSLGQCGELVETVLSHGYRLRMEPPIPLDTSP